MIRRLLLALLAAAGLFSAPAKADLPWTSSGLWTGGELAQIYLPFRSVGSWTGSPVTAAFTVSRDGSTGGDICVAPCAVLVDASTSSAVGVTDPFHKLHFTWTFGDPASNAAWTTGTRTASASKNAATGPIAAHVFESPGAYTIGLTVTDGTNTAPQITRIITVTDPDTHFAASTLCARQTSGGSFSGCPLIPSVYADAAACITAGKCVDSADFDALINTTAGSGATYKRVMVECDGTYTNSAWSEVTADGPGYIGAYPVGCPARAKPIITGAFGKLRFGNNSNHDMCDWRVVDLYLDGVSDPSAQYGITANGAMCRLTVLRTTFTNLNAGMFNQLSTLDAINASSQLAPVWSEWIVQDSAFDGGDTTRFQVAVKNSAFIGNTIANLASGHALRMVYAQKFIISNNTITGTASGAAVTVRGLRYTPSERQSISPTMGGNEYTVPAGEASYTQQVVIAENILNASGGTLPFSVHAVTVTDDVRFRNILAEGNWIVAGSASTNLFSVESSLTTFRNNICDFSAGPTGANLCSTLQQNGGPVADSIWIYNNSLYSTQASASSPVVVFQTSGAQTNIEVKNNAAYSPNNTDDETGPVRNLGTAGITASNNSTKAQMQAATSPFVDSTPAAPGDYDAADYAVDGGTAVPVWRDFFQVLRTGTYDLGAVLP